MSRAKRARSETRHGEGSNAEPSSTGSRPVRQGIPRVDYSETKRRRAAAPRKRKADVVSPAYMDMSGARGGRVTLQRAIAVGEAAIERIVGDAYEWRDGAYEKKRRIVFDDGG